MAFKKCPVMLHPDKSCLFKYQELLTSYSSSLLVKQFKLSNKVKITETACVDKNSYTETIPVNGRSFQTSDCQCSCGFYKVMELSCRHILHYVNMLILILFKQSSVLHDGLVIIIGTVIKFFNKCLCFNECKCLHNEKLPALKVLSQNEKYCKIFVLAQKLGNVASHISTREFSSAIQCLDKVLKAWEQGQRVTIEVVDIKNCHDEEENDIVRNDRCDDTVVSHVEFNDDNPLPNLTTKNHLDIDKYFNANE